MKTSGTGKTRFYGDILPSTQRGSEMRNLDFKQKERF